MPRKGTRVVTKILVVNEDAGLFERIQSRFQADEPGFEVFSAISGPRAIGIAQQRKPDVIIVDGDLVGLAGHALTLQLKADPDLAARPSLNLRHQPAAPRRPTTRPASGAGRRPEAPTFPRARRGNRFVKPQTAPQRSLEQEVIAIRRNRQAIQPPLGGVATQQQAEIIAALPCDDPQA